MQPNFSQLSSNQMSRLHTTCGIVMILQIFPLYQGPFSEFLTAYMSPTCNISKGGAKSTWNRRLQIHVSFHQILYKLKHTDQHRNKT